MTKVAAILGAVNAALASVLAFGIDVTQPQQAAITAGVNALLVLVAVLRDPTVPFSLTKKKDA